MQTSGEWVRCPNQKCKIGLKIMFDCDTQCGDCKTIFRYVHCPYLDCSQTLLFKQNEFVPGKKYQCLKCKKPFQRILCPHCQKKCTFTNKLYVEGSVVKCEQCDKSFQQINCAQCRKCISYPSCNYRQGTIVSCPYNGCKKKFQHVVCPHCIQSVLFTNCNFRHGLRQTCPYRQTCGKEFQMVSCSHCLQPVFYPKCGFVEGKKHTCHSNCKKEFQMILCGFCQGSISFKTCDYKLGNKTRCPYPQCHNQFQQITCPHCTHSIVFKNSDYKESKKMTCPYQQCGKVFQHMNCPHCSSPNAWRKGNYYEGEFVKCSDCSKLFQHIGCPHCRNTIIWREANKREADLQQCPYTGCKKKFFHFNCKHCRKPVVVGDWKKFIPGSQIQCPYDTCKETFLPSSSPSHLLEKEPKNTIYFPKKEEEEEEEGEGEQQNETWTFDQFIKHRDEPWNFSSSSKMINIRDISREKDQKTGHPKILGTGSFGSSFRAQIRGNPVMIKEAQVSLSPDIEKEIDDIRSIKHPYLLTPIGFSCPTEKLVWLISMNHLNLTSLHDVLKNNNNNISWFEKWFLMRKMTEIVRVLHRNEMIHRDLKLSNFLISKSLKLMKISDFGLRSLKAISRRQTSGRLRPTAGYLAPELVGCPNPRQTLETDIYAMGCMFYEIVTGVPPYDVSEAQTMFLIKQGTLPEFPESVPKLFVELIKWTWLRDSSERPNCDEILSFFKENTIMFVDENPCLNQNLLFPVIFSCPISLEIMENPVILKETGESFSKKIIVDWIKNSKVDPMTGNDLKFQIQIPDVTLKCGIDSWKKCCTEEE